MSVNATCELSQKNEVLLKEEAVRAKVPCNQKSTQSEGRFQTMAGKKGGGKVGRSSVTGKFVTVKYAKSHPKTTEVERIKKPGKK
jgi:hypothetical protein